MSYVNAAKRPNPVAAMGALGVPAAFGALLIVGLAVSAVGPVAGPHLDVFDVVEPPVIEELPDPVEPKETVSDTVTPQDPFVPAPRPDTDFTFDNTARDPISELVDPGPVIVTREPVDFGKPVSPPRFDPIAASPRGNPGNWVTNNDYRTSWINRGYEGVASFTLNVDVSGRVSDCTITSSTGHAALDDATCSLLQRRGRFDPAKDSAGKTVVGTYRSSIRWTIPE